MADNPYGPDDPDDLDPSDVSRARDRSGERAASDPDVEGTPLRQAVIELRERNPDMTQRQIAESAGCSEPYVSDIL